MIGSRGVLLPGLLAFWGLGTVAAFWHFEGQYLRPAARPAGAATVLPNTLPTVPTLTTDRGTIRLGGPGPITLINFWNPDCPCSRYAEAHVRRLGQQYGAHGVRLVTVVECGRAASVQQTAMQAWQGRGLTDFAAAPDPGGQVARAFGVWAAPAAVILDSRGRVAYLGAYNAARYCNDTHTAWAQQALDAVLAGRKPTRAKTLFFGCQVVGQDG
jgi:hypothetical protein